MRECLHHTLKLFSRFVLLAGNLEVLFITVLASLDHKLFWIYLRIGYRRYSFICILVENSKVLEFQFHIQLYIRKFFFCKQCHHYPVLQLLQSSFSWQLSYPNLNIFPTSQMIYYTIGLITLRNCIQIKDLNLWPIIPNSHKILSEHLWFDYEFQI